MATAQANLPGPFAKKAFLLEGVPGKEFCQAVARVHWWKDGSYLPCTYVMHTTGRTGLSMSRGVSRF